FRHRLRARGADRRKQGTEAVSRLVPQPRGFPRGLHAQHRATGRRGGKAAPAAHWRLLVPARPPPDRRRAPDRRAARRPLPAGPDGESGVISVYARGQDYHDTVKKRLKALARWVAERWPGELKVFVDTAPVMEKPLAQQAGIGWQGKHTNLVSRGFGSWLFLGEIYLSLELEPDMPEEDHCGACRRCLDSCPTNAFPAPYNLDARRCISYLTIEHKGPIPQELRPLIGNRIFGCDDCLAVCPWNKFARAGHEPDFLPRAALTAPRL